VKSTDEVGKLHLPHSVFLGFLPKKITPCPEWLKAQAPQITQICSVSRCISSLTCAFHVIKKGLINLMAIRYNTCT